MIDISVTDSGISISCWFAIPAFPFSFVTTCSTKEFQLCGSRLPGVGWLRLPPLSSPSPPLQLPLPIPTADSFRFSSIFHNIDMNKGGFPCAAEYVLLLPVSLLFTDPHFFTPFCIMNNRSVILYFSGFSGYAAWISVYFIYLNKIYNRRHCYEFRWNQTNPILFGILL